MVTCCAISRTSTPSAAAALNTRAPSQCSGNPCSLALQSHTTRQQSVSLSSWTLYRAGETQLTSHSVCTLWGCIITYYCDTIHRGLAHHSEIERMYSRDRTRPPSRLCVCSMHTMLGGAKCWSTGRSLQ